MKRNQNYFILCLILLFSINLITAQTVKNKFKHSGDRSEKKIQKLKAALALTDAQVSQVTAIHTDYATKIKAAKDAASERGAAKEAVKTLRTERDAAIKTILNSEQVAKFEAMKAERKDRRGHKGRRGGRGPGKHRGTPEERAARHTEKLTEKLSLSAEQAAKVSAINTEFAAKRKATKEAATEEGVDRATKDALRTEHKAAIKAVLTPEQVATFEAMKKDRKGRRGGRGHGKHGGTPEERAAKHTERLTEKLSLSPEQTAKVSAINTEFSTKRKAIKEATTERGAAKEAMKALRGEQKAAIKAVLTAEQIAIFDTMKKGRRGGKGRGK